MNDQEKLVIREWTNDEPLPEQSRWKMSFRNDTTYLECESDSLWAVIRVMFSAWKRQRKKK
jgi:hypothetical protein